jgi:hypothetical protein
MALKLMPKTLSADIEDKKINLRRLSFSRQPVRFFILLFLLTTEEVKCVGHT